MELCILTPSPRWSQTSPLFCVHFSTALLAFTGKFSPKCKNKIDPCNPANTSTLNQRGKNVDCQHSSTLFQRWYLVENERWADVHLSTLFQRWQNNVETSLIELRRFNVDEPMLFQRWNLVEIESWADICLSTLFQRWQNNVETTLTRQFNVNNPMLFQR